MSDVQASAEYVTHAIRTVSASSGKKVDLVGHSQGGMIGRWTTMWWPDTRDLVGNMVGLGSSNNGSELFTLGCTALGSCPESAWQQSSGSEFMSILNEEPESYPGIQYTTISTRFDEIVVPYSNAFLPEQGNVTNITLQNQCPNEPVEHFALMISNPVWKLATKALDGDPAPRVSKDDCLKLMPGVDAAGLPQAVPGALGQSLEAIVGADWTNREPAPAEYADAG